MSSDVLTSIQSPHTGPGSGWAEYGRKTREEMIAIHRKNVERDLKVAQAILDTPDAEFVVEQYRGVWARNDIIRLEPDGTVTQVSPKKARR